jgi:bifunctional UDP-N-acetylglucosamine pyrophosphorylase/glucosamine-1-phosphate N-acetyltransferase
MAQSAVQAIVLAAGKSSRLKTGITKLSYTLCGREMILYPISMLHALELPITMVVGYQQEIIKNIIERARIDVNFIEQKEQLGTGHAVMLTKNSWQADHILVMNGDMPLVTAELIQNLIEKHCTQNAAVSCVVSHNTDPSLTGYGRVVIQHGITTIVEAKDFTGDPTATCCINAGIYIFKRSFLEQYAEQLSPNNKAKELYLTDLIGMASKAGLPVELVYAPFDMIRGINTLKELWAAEHIKRSELIAYWMDHGVHFTAAQTTHIDCDITIGAGTCIEAGVQITAGSHIGENCFIDAFSLIQNSVLAPRVIIKPHTIVQDSKIESQAEIGPFAHVRSNSAVGTQTIIGNFVEVNRSSIAEKTKIKHLSYIGDAHIGSHVNIGAGTITVNYNGVTKNKTVIEDHAFIGSNNSLIAPVTVAQGAMTAAGSTITHDVPENALAIARARQINKEGYAQKIRSAPFIAAVKTTAAIQEES